MESTTEVSNLEMNVTLECPEYSQETGLLVEEFAFWIEGVCLCLIAIPGIFGNCLSSYILAGKSMRNSFNLLLIGLAMYDNTYLVCAMLESIRKRFSFQTDIHILLFPYFLYPLHMMAMTGSILMTVAIALERYSAVHWPIAYSQTMNDSRALKRRVFKYLVPVTLISIVFNITKFFEIQVVWNPINNGTLLDPSSNETTIDNTTEYRIGLKITEFRTDPMYSINFNWFRFIAIGVLPFLLLVFFNTQIYLDIRKQRRRKRAAKAKRFGEHTKVEAPEDPGLTTAQKWRDTIKKMLPAKKGPSKGSGDFKMEEEEEIVQIDCSAKDDQNRKILIHQDNDNRPQRAILRTKVEEVEQDTEVRGSGMPLVKVTVGNGQEDKENSSLSSTKEEGQASPCSSSGASCAKCPECCGSAGYENKNPEAIVASSTENGHLGPLDDINVVEKQALNTSSTGTSTEVVKVKVNTMNNGAQTTKTTAKAQTAVGTKGKAQSQMAPNKNKEQEKGGNKETSLAFIMMVYVLVFLICHSPKLLLNLHEITTIRNAMACGRDGRQTFPVWSLVVMHISHLLLVINSAINILIYCCLSSKFREEGIQVMQAFIHFMSCGRLYDRQPPLRSMATRSTTLRRV